MKKILMVCLGNICRSPLAEGIIRHKVLQNGIEIEIDSAGTAAYHVGEAPHKDSIKVARVNGIDISGLKARKFQVEDFEKFDLIYAMDHQNLIDLLALTNQPLHREKIRLILKELDRAVVKDVPDPWYGTYRDFEFVFNMLDEVCEAILQKIIEEKI